MDGRKSFIFSWNKKHREIHEDALLHYFDPSKKGQKFEYQPKSPSEVSIKDKDSEAENKNTPRDINDKYQVKYKYNPLSWYTMEYSTIHFPRYTHEPVNNGQPTQSMQSTMGRFGVIPLSKTALQYSDWLYFLMRGIK